MSENKKATYISIQMVRGIAAIIIVLFHSHIAIDMMPNDHKINIPFVYSHGHWAVYLFFVVSGFIITHVTSSGRFKLLPFIAKRFVRIYPIWWLSIAFTLIGLFIFNVSFSYGTPLTIDSFIKSALLLPSAYKPVNSVGWTLIFEVIFYLVSALVLIRHSHKILIVALLSLFGVGAILYYISPSHPWLVNALGHHLFSQFQLLFATGIALYLYQDKLLWIHPAVACIISAATLVGVIYAPSAVLGSGELYFTVIGVSLASSLLIVSLLNCEKRGWLQNEGNAVATIVSLLSSAGNCSFSLYLFHWGIFTIVGSKATQSYLGMPSWSSELWRFGWIFISIAMAILIYRNFEIPTSRIGGSLINKIYNKTNKKSDIGTA